MEKVVKGGLGTDLLLKQQHVKTDMPTVPVYPPSVHGPIWAPPLRPGFHWDPFNSNLGLDTLGTPIYRLCWEEKLATWNGHPADPQVYVPLICVEKTTWQR